MLDLCELESARAGTITVHDHLAIDKVLLSSPIHFLDRAWARRRPSGSSETAATTTVCLFERVHSTVPI